MDLTSEQPMHKTLCDGQPLAETCLVSGNEIDTSTLTSLVNHTGQALALLDVSADCLRWCSKGWEEALPDIPAGCSWQQALNARPALMQLYDGFKAQQLASGLLWCEVPGTDKELTFGQLESGLVSLQLLESHRATGDMHLYMQARENMFTTSRTISVSEMATTLAHEIKQPVATIINILKAVRLRLQRSDMKPDQLEEALVNALEQAQFTNSVINRIRDFTQARRPQQKTVNIIELTRESLSLMDWLLSANQCRTELTVGDEALWCDGDPTMLQQVLVNLLRNGIEAMHETKPADRYIVIDCRRAGSMARLSIRDNGHGLAGNEKQLFVPFSTSKANGMGVGLNICRSFVELHQGRLWLSPDSEGGCVSNVELPLKTFNNV